MTSTPIFALHGGSVRYGAEPEAVSDVSVELHRGEILGLVGESGCGKSTTARAMLGMVPLSRGELSLHGRTVQPNSAELRSSVQAIFQNPTASFNPRRSILASVMEPLRVHGRGDKAERRERALDELARVGISPQMAQRRPNEISGGQCQRAAIARATILRPEVLVCDEPVSALDVSIQAQILELLAELRDQQGLAMLFISHDLGVVASLCDRTAVMYAGTIVERGPSAVIADLPAHPYSVVLQDAVPTIDDPVDRGVRVEMKLLDAEVDGRGLPGCRFEALCPFATPECSATPPRPTAIGQDHLVSCYHPMVTADTGR